MGIPVYKVQGLAEGSPASLPEGERMFLYCRLPTGAESQLGEYCRRGFEIVEVTIDLMLVPRRDLSVSRERICVRAATASDVKQVGEIAAQAFQMSRFHVDPRTKSRASDIKREWAMNLCLGVRGIACWVAEIDGTVVGFLGIVDIGHDRPRAAIDLIAVQPGYQGQAIGQALVVKLNEWALTNSRTLVTGTQLGNTRALNFYENLGFRIVGGSTVLHGYT